MFASHTPLLFHLSQSALFKFKLHMSYSVR